MHSGEGGDAEEAKAIAQLSAAIERRKPVRVVAILQQRPELANRCDQYGDTPLIDAVWSNSATLVQALLDCGARPNDQGSCGRVALHWAAERNSWKCAESLLSGGADPEIVDAYEFTPLQTAAIDKDIYKGGRVGRILLEWGVKYDLLSATAMGDTAKVAEILAAEPQAIANHPHGDWLLNRVNCAIEDEILMAPGRRKSPRNVFRSYRRLIELLVRHGASLNAPARGGGNVFIQRLLTFYGDHPLEEPVDLDFLRFLIGLGADVNARNDEGLTALAAAIKWRKHPSVIELFRSEGGVE